MFIANRMANFRANKALNTRRSRALQQPQPGRALLYLAAANWTCANITLFDEYGAAPPR
jgi:hypothetical protein